ncbi:CotH kinase family protein [Tindallia californiensis]|uniref:Fn3 associated n=1 Tax=Tindallia californiensis TaxID=159292 RepID=A0A1H3PDV5_9FIRM|nr:CotH kinase family protein [Tindallia californiensis]SDY99352.1 Fn3 associated [Tindallia californiensis]
MKNKFPIFIFSLIALGLVGFVLFLQPAPPVEGLVINEVMTSNGETLQDGHGDYPNWIEIYNKGTETIQLNGVFLSDNQNNLTKWQFPKVTLYPESHLLVYASEKENPVAEELHANFSLSAGGDTLYLTAPDGETILDELDIVPLPRDVSYGRITDGSDAWAYFQPATPGHSNTLSQPLEEQVAAPVFSHTTGFYPDTVTLELEAEEGATIHYTLDGSWPTENDPIYTEPITLNPETVGPDHQPTPLSFIPTASDDLFPDWGYDRYLYIPPAEPITRYPVVRAMAVKETHLTSPVETHTYFIGNEAAEHQLPIISIAVNPEDLMDEDQGIYVPGTIFDQWREENPEEPVTGAVPANYNQRGREWERPAHMTFIESPSPLAGEGQTFSQNIGLRIHGGWTRAWTAKSLRLYARRHYDTEHWFNYEFFPGYQGTGTGETIDRYKRLILRTSGNDWSMTMFRDALIHELVADTKVDRQAYRPMILYLNGEYWGIHNLRERLDQYYIMSHYGIEEDKVIVINEPLREVERGVPSDLEDFDKDMRAIMGVSLSAEERYQRAKEIIDIPTWIDYLTTSLYGGNIDWIENNVRIWRTRTDGYDPEATFGQDGRWRWILFDVDLAFDFQGFGYQTHNTIEWLEDKSELFHTLIRSQSFRHQFVQRYNDLLNTIYSEQNVLHMIDQLASIYEPEISRMVERWPNFQSLENWQQEVDVLRQFASERPTHVRNHMAAMYDLGEPVEITVALPDSSDGDITLNSLEDVSLRKHANVLSPSGNVPSPLAGEGQGEGEMHFPETCFSGHYFPTIPITLTAYPAEGKNFSYWEMDGEPYSDQATITITPEEGKRIRPVF